MICEGCIKQDTCKYKEVVEEYEADAPEMLFDEPLEVIIQCKYKETCIPYPPNCGTATYTYDPNSVEWSGTTHCPDDPNITLTS